MISFEPTSKHLEFYICMIHRALTAH